MRRTGPPSKTKRTENAQTAYCVVDAAGLGNLGPRLDKHRHKRAKLSAACPGTRLSRLLRPASEFELFLLRRPVLGVPGRQLVQEQLVQRAMAVDGT